MNILKILTLSGVATTLALTNNQMKVEDCPECDSAPTSETTILGENETAQDSGSNIKLFDANDNTTDESTSNIKLPDDISDEEGQNLTEEDNAKNTDENLDKNDTTQTPQIKYNYADYFACYENVKEKLTSILELNQKYSEKCEDCNDLTDEEKDKLEADFKELEVLIEQLQDTNQNILCNITGECDTEDDIMLILGHLQKRIDTLQNAIMLSRNFAFYNPNANVYGYYYRYYPKENFDEETDTDNEDSINETENKNGKNVDTFSRKKWTSNIDTYGPEYRNIDTFFNTALLDDNMFDYNGENYMGNYGMGYMGNPYMFGGRVNGHNGSNGGYRNPNYNNQNNNENNTTESNSPNNHNIKIDTDTQDNQEQKKFKFGKNIDTYLDDTMQGNVNTMGGKKVTDYVRDLFNKHFKKDKPNSKKPMPKTDNNNDSVEQIPQSEINDYVDNFIDKNKTQIDEDFLIDEQAISTFNIQNENNSNENFPELKKIEFPNLY